MMLVNWNNQNADKVVPPQAPMNYYMVKGDPERKYFSEQQYNQYLRMSGELTLEVLGRIESKLNFDKPSKRDIEILQKVITKARTVAKQRLVAIIINKRIEVE